jgi:hypothetical protein
MFKYASIAALYYTLVKVLYKICALYIGWHYDGFMARWYDLNHYAIRSIYVIGGKLDNVVRDNFSDGDLVFWELWFIILPAILILLRFIFLRIKNELAAHHII